MRLRSTALLASLTAVLCAWALSAGAATLSVAAPEWFVLHVSVVASDGSEPIPPVLFGRSVAGAVTAGSMELGASDVSFWFSIFSEESPLVLTGSHGDIPVVLRIDEIRYESPAPGGGAASVIGPPPWLVGSVSGTLRGSLTVGSTETPFLLTSAGPWYTDGSPEGSIAFHLGPDRATLGYLDPITGEPDSLVSGLGSFSGTDLVTLDGVTFGLSNIHPEFRALVYVPEPGTISLLGLAGAALFLARQRSRTRRAMLPAAFLGA